VLLSKGPEAIAKWKQVAEELGIVSERQARAAVAIRNAFADMDRAITQVGRRFIDIFGTDILATLRTAARVIAQNLDDVVALITKAIGAAVYLVAMIVQWLVGLLGVLESIAKFFNADFGVGFTAAAQRANDLAAELQGARGELEKLQAAAGTGQDVGGQIATVERTIRDLQTQLAIQEAISTALGWGSGQAQGFGENVGRLVERFRELYGLAREQAAADINGTGLVPKPEDVDRTTSAFEKYFATIGRGFKSWVDGLKDLTQQAQDGVQQLTGTIDTQLTGALVDAINRTRSWKEAFREAARAILLEINRLIARFIVLQFLQAAIGGAIGGLTGGGKGSTADAAADAGYKRAGAGGNLAAFSAGGGGGSLGSYFGGGGGGGGEVAVNFSVLAMDSKSFRQALAEQRRDIVGIVEEAVRRQPATRRLITGR
jgi:hypothetical protein